MVDGKVSKGDTVVMMNTGKEYTLDEIGVLAPVKTPVSVCLFLQGEGEQLDFRKPGPVGGAPTYQDNMALRLGGSGGWGDGKEGVARQGGGMVDGKVSKGGVVVITGALAARPTWGRKWCDMGTRHTLLDLHSGCFACFRVWLDYQPSQAQKQGQQSGSLCRPGSSRGLIIMMIKADSKTKGGPVL